MIVAARHHVAVCYVLNICKCWCLALLCVDFLFVSFKCRDFFSSECRPCSQDEMLEAYCSSDFGKQCFAVFNCDCINH